VLRSSGQPTLDKAAMEILRIAAPFPAFPEPLRASAAELNFSYDWEFFPGDRSELRVGRP
jgi:protein TonB